MKKKIFITLGVLLVALFIALYATQKTYKPFKQDIGNNEIKDGDIIFQTTQSRQCEAVQLATHSPFSHCGLIYKEGDRYVVFEAVQPVKKTPLDKWIERGKGEHFVIKRLKNADEVLTPETLDKMKKVGKSFDGKNYDVYFGWSDEKIYCSELVWKIYQRATGIEVGKLEKLRDFDLTSDIVKEIMQERYGDNIPWDETVISPADIFDSNLLVTVKTN